MEFEMSRAHTLTTRMTGWTSSLSSRLRLRKTEPFSGSRKKSRYSAPPFCFFYVPKLNKHICNACGKLFFSFSSEISGRNVYTSIPCISNGCIDSGVLINGPHRFRSDFQTRSLGKSRVRLALLVSENCPPTSNS